jgi:hypothetical protein
MSVEFEPKEQGDASFCFGVSNGTWFWLLNNTDIGGIICQENTNDPIDASEEDALLCADIMRDIELPDTWAGEVIPSEKMRQTFINFFESCEGFITH